MDWLLILVAAAVAAIVSRVYISMRKLRREQEDNWDAKVIERMRKEGADPFQPHDVSFFFALPTSDAAADIQRRLEPDGYAVETKSVAQDAEYPISLLARKTMRLSAPEMSGISKRFQALAREKGGRYDGWV